jgi:hypothetical protein
MSSLRLPAPGRFPAGGLLLASLFLAGGLLPPFPAGALAQGISLSSLPIPGSESEDRLRLGHLRGERKGDGFLLRTPSLLLERALGEGSRGASLTFLAPEVRTHWSSDLPFAFNQGPLRGGRGWNHLVTAGVRVRLWVLTLVVAPQFVHEENRPHQIFPYPLQANPPRDLYANPFHPPPESMDLPLRFGRDPRTHLDPGQSSLTLAVGPLAVGASTENTWWGPGLRNGLLLSGQAPGVPHVFLRSSRPVWMGLGTLEGRWMLGRLEESEYFDFDPANDFRSLAALAVTFSPAFDPGLTLGVARAVYGPLQGEVPDAERALDVFRSVGRPHQRPWPETGDPWGREEPLPVPEPAPDQIFALFARWVIPAAGAEAYGEWVRFEEPGGTRDFLQFPQHSQGYTVGMQWVGGGMGQAALRAQGELTNLEPSSTWRHRNVAGSYTSRVVPHGYTHRGEVLGAAIGPASSSQWVALDLLAPGWRLGTFGGRIRRNTAAHYRDLTPLPRRDDVSLYWGLRGGVDLWGWGVWGEASHGVRLNYLFQGYPPDPVTGKADGVDVTNVTVSLAVSKLVTR